MGRSIRRELGAEKGTPDAQHQPRGPGDSWRDRPATGTETVYRLQAAVGNRVTVALLARGREAGPLRRLSVSRRATGPTVQRKPTVDLASLYKGKGEETEVADFVQLQALLSDRARSSVHLRALSTVLEERLKRTPLPAGPVEARGEAASAMLDEVLASFEMRCGFSPERPILVGFASADDFKALTQAGQQFHDVGAGVMHGEFTHRIQWFIAMSEITGGEFKGPKPPFTHTPRELYRASMSDAYAVDATSVTGKAYMWDWVFDRIAGLRPQGGGGQIDYSPVDDAWTHPGETNQQGALSNDLLSGNIDGVGALAELRGAQTEGHQANKANMTAWFEAAAEVGVAEGQAVTGGPSYFQRDLIPGPDTMKQLDLAKFMAQGLIGRATSWSSMAGISLYPASTDAQLPTLQRLSDETAGWWTTRRDFVGSQRDTTKLAVAMVDAWFASLQQAVAGALGKAQAITRGTATDKARLVPITAQLAIDLAAIEGRASWRVV